MTVGKRVGRRLAARLVVVGTACVFGSPAAAAPPVLTSVRHIDGRPAATWTLPPGVTSQVVEVATSPATSTDGDFFSENVEAFDLLEDAQTSWVDDFQLDPGVYYLHVGGFEEPCYFAGLCPIQEFTQIGTLRIAPPASSARAAPVRGHCPLDPPGRSEAQRKLDVPRRYRPRPFPQRERAPRGAAGLSGLLHAEPPPGV
jgi:hypothetical protein